MPDGSDQEKKLTAFCNKCGWIGRAEPGLSAIPHEGCNYTACYSPTEVKLHELIEAAERFSNWYDELSKYFHDLDDYKDDQFIGNFISEAEELRLGDFRALCTALNRAKGGE